MCRKLTQRIRLWNESEWQERVVNASVDASVNASVNARERLRQSNPGARNETMRASPLDTLEMDDVETRRRGDEATR